ncbi:MAG: hypothetical protein KDA80_07535, partial [Planctomycetaceae bacterium]|nr:hypothetical protein [Planctomycetaceae bacterium]
MRGSPLLTIIFAEAGRTAILVLAMLAVFAFLSQAVFPVPGQPAGLIDGTVHFLKTCHLNRHGNPVAPELWGATWQTAPLAMGASLLITIVSVVSGAVLAECPRIQFLKYGLLAVSAVPCFVIPFLVPLLWPGVQFQGFQNSELLWPMLAIAVGDLNLYSVTSV